MTLHDANWNVLDGAELSLALSELANGAALKVTSERGDRVMSQSEFIDHHLPSKSLTVTARQIRLALNQLGLRDAVESAVQLADQNTRDEWEYATEIKSTWPSFVAMAQSLGKTDAEIESLFQLAMTL